MQGKNNLWVLVGGVTLSAASYTMIIPFLPLYLMEVGATPDNVKMWSGISFSVTFLIAAILAPYWGRLADRSGKKRMAMRAGYSLAFTYVLGYFVGSPLAMVGMRAVQGVANGFVPAAMALVASTSPPHKLAMNLGILQTGLVVGSIIGPLIGGTLAHTVGMRATFLVAAVSIAIATLTVKFLVYEPPIASAKQEQSIGQYFREALNNRMLLVALSLLFCTQIVSMLLQPVLTLYVMELQHNSEGAALATGIVFSLAGVAGAIAAPIWGRFNQTMGFRKILVLAFGGAGLFNLCQYFVGNIYQFGAIQFMYGLFIIGVYPTLNTIAVSSNGGKNQGGVFGLIQVANQLGSMVGPILGGVVGTWLGIRPVFIFTAGILLLLSTLVFIRMPDGQRAVIKGNQ